MLVDRVLFELVGNIAPDLFAELVYRNGVEAFLILAHMPIDSPDKLSHQWESLAELAVYEFRL